MKAYITGIAGFLGSHLADYLLAQGHKVYGCDDLSTGHHGNLVHTCGAVHWRLGSVEYISPVVLNGIDVVYHCAAAAYEGVSSFSPAFISKNIYAGSAAVFSAAIAAGVKRIVFTSSMARYGEAIIGSSRYGSYPKSFDEDLIPKPVDPYGIAKEAAERLLINLCETHQVEWTIAVPHNIYGPRQKYDDPYRNVAAIMANRMLQGKQPIIYGDGSQSRCFSYIDDVVPSLARMGLDDAAGNEIINIGPDNSITHILTLGRLLAGIIGIEYDPIFLPSRPREVAHAICSSDKVRRLLDFEQKVELRDGLINLVEYIRERGPKPFNYHLPLEIRSALAPSTWSTKTM